MESVEEIDDDMSHPTPPPRKGYFGFCDKTHSEGSPADVEYEQEESEKSEEQLDEQMLEEA